ncbi:MAG: HEAT repeat domain-containing protein, partial [Gemmataceae bacterium]|nr:HEAT repeat domain-containing protein [Gemmataceae bacterium]
ADALGRIGAGPAAGPLQARLRDAVADVRQAAAEALGRLGRAAVPAVPLLLELQGDKAEAVRRAATDALVKIVTGTSHDAG